MKNNDIQGQYRQIFHRIARLRLDPLFHDISEGEFAVLQKIYRIQRSIRMPRRFPYRKSLSPSASLPLPYREWYGFWRRKTMFSVWKADGTGVIRCSASQMREKLSGKILFPF